MATTRGEPIHARNPARPRPAPSGRQAASPPPWVEARPAQPQDDGHEGPADHDRHQDRRADGQREPDADRQHGRDEDRTDPTRAPTSSRTRMWISIAAALLIVVAGAGWYWWRGQPAGNQQASNQQQGAESGGSGGAGGRVPVGVAEVRTGDLPIFLNGLGSVQAFNTVTIRARVDGEIVQIGFEEGQVVQKGDLIAQIDPRPYQAALDQAVAKKAQDEATLASNRLDLERTRQLARNAFASQQQLDQQTANVASLTAQVASDTAAIQSAQTQLGYTTIRAPLTGRTGLRLVDQGNIVRAGDTAGIVEIAQINPISVVFTAPEAQLRPIASAMKQGSVAVTALSPDGKTVLDEGRLVLINNEVDAGSGTVRLKAAFENKADLLWPGLSVNTRLLQTTLRGAVAVPSEAVQRGQDSLFAFVVGEGDKAQRRAIKVETFTEGQAVVEDGLRPGERVVVSGQYRLTDGVEVQVAGAPPAPGGAAREAGEGGKAKPDRSAPQGK